MSPNNPKTGPLLIDGFSLQLEDLEPVADGQQEVKLSQSALKQLAASRATVEKILASGEPVYGITTGFGKFKDVYIDPADSKALQKNLILSHAAGVGAYLETRVSRTMMLLRANALAKGFSGIRPSVVQLLIDCLNAGVHPLIPEKGSLGASGDLAPLAHLTLLLIGHGKAEYQGKEMTATEALAKANLKPVELEAKEGLALTNGTQAMAAIGALTLLKAERLAKMADIIGAMSLEAQLGSAKAFDERIHKARPMPGQLASAANLRLLLKDSGIVESHTDCPMVQDAYSLRCMPQVHGASRQAFAHVRSILEIEINSATDNPLVFGDDVLSGGNFHGQPLALPFDYMSIALAELANISERRTERLVNSALSNGLPAFLTEFGGLNSGFMIAHYTAAALVSENKSLAHPASVDSIPTSANQEDHVSMGTIGSRKARDILGNTTKVLAIELLCATQGLDFRLKNNTDTSHNIETLSPGPGLQAAYDFVRSKITHLDEDREIHLDMDAAEQIVAGGEFLKAVEVSLGPLQ